MDCALAAWENITTFCSTSTTFISCEDVHNTCLRVKLIVNIDHAAPAFASSKGGPWCFHVRKASVKKESCHFQASMQTCTWSLRVRRSAVFLPRELKIRNICYGVKQSTLKTFLPEFHAGLLRHLHGSEETPLRQVESLCRHRQNHPQPCHLDHPP